MAFEDAHFVDDDAEHEEEDELDELVDEHEESELSGGLLPADVLLLVERTTRGRLMLEPVAPFDILLLFAVDSGIA